MCVICVLLRRLLCTAVAAEEQRILFLRKTSEEKHSHLRKNVHLTSSLLPLVDIKKLFKFTLAPYYLFPCYAGKGGKFYRITIKDILL